MKLHSNPHRPRSILAGLLALTLMFSMLPTAFAAQQNSYHDPAEHWMQASGRTNELDANSVITHETFTCHECGKQTSFLAFRVPEYTKNGQSALSRNVKYSDGTMVGGNGKGDTMDGVPGKNATYTGYHYTKAVCETCGGINTNMATTDYGYLKNVYWLYDCAAEFTQKLDETVTYEYADDTYHTVTTKGGTYCAFCYGTNHTESSKLERHSMVTEVLPQPANGRFAIAFILSQIFKWEFVQQIENCYFMLICLLVSIGFTVLGIVLTLYGYIWKIEYDTQEIIYRSALGITRKYRIEDITRCVGKRRNQYRFYQGEKKIFQYEMDAEGDVYDLLIILKKRGIDEEELIPSTKEHCIVEPMIIRKILPIIGFCIYTFFTIVLFLTRDGKIWMYLLLGVIDLLLLYYSGVYWYDQLEVQDKLYKKDFLKKMRTVEFKEITKVEQHKSIIEKEYIIIYVKGEKPIKIDRYNENVEVLLMRLKDEKISVM